MRDTAWATASRAELEGLRDHLLALERADGVTPVHREATDRLLDARDHHLEHSRPHRNRLVAVGLSPDGRLLATASMPGTDAWQAGGALAIWDVRCGRVVEVATEVAGGVGWGSRSGELVWSRAGRRIVSVHNTNQLGVFEPEHGAWFLGADIDLTDGQDHPPVFAVSPDGRRAVVATWGPEGTGPVVVVALDADVAWHHGAAAPEGCRWTRAALPRAERLWWTAWGIVGCSRGLAFCLDPDTLALVWSVDAPGAADGTLDLATGRLVVADRSTVRWLALASGEVVHELELEVPVRGLVADPHGVGRLAVLVDAGVVLWADGLAAVVHEAPAWRGPRDLPDAPVVAFAPAGNRVVVRTDEELLCIDWSGDVRARVPAPQTLTGLLWGDRLVGLGPSLLAFYDDALVAESIHDLAPPPGLAEPAPTYDHWAFEQDFPPGVFPVPLAEPLDWGWVVVGDDGTVGITSRVTQPLDDVLVVSVDPVGLAWPWRWAAHRVAVATIDGPPPRDEPADAFVLVAPRRELGPMPDHVVDVAIAPRGPRSCFVAPAPCLDPATRPEVVEALEGGAVLFATRSDPRDVWTAAVLSVHDGMVQWFHSEQHGHVGGGVALHELAWIGEACWRGD